MQIHLGGILPRIGPITAASAALVLLASICGASPLFNLSVGGFESAVCPTPQQNMFSQSGTTPLSPDVPTLGGTCPGPDPISDSISAMAHAEAGGVSASVNTIGPGAGGGANSLYMDTFTLHRPPNSPDTGVSFSVTSNYTLTVGGLGAPGATATASLDMQVPLFDFDSKVIVFQQNGTSTGLLDSSQFIFAHCPCVFSMSLIAQAAAGNGGSASAADPVTINLPPGWTYTAASQDFTTPEPGGLFTVSSALLALGVYCRRVRIDSTTTTRG